MPKVNIKHVKRPTLEAQQIWNQYLKDKKIVEHEKMFGFYWGRWTTLNPFGKPDFAFQIYDNFMYIHGSKINIEEVFEIAAYHEQLFGGELTIKNKDIL